jgi:DNA gyrase subunit B
MPKLVEGGFLYVAQPPLYKVSRGKSFQYIGDEREYDRYMIKKISNEFQLKANRLQEPLRGDQFRRVLQKFIAKKNTLAALERRNYPFFLINTLLQHEVDGVDFLRDKAKMQAIQSFLKEKDIDCSLLKDEEHGLYELSVTFGVNGLQVVCKVDMSLITSARYQNLYKIHMDLKDYKPPFQILTNGESIKIENESKLLDYLNQNGKKGIVIQRYKGLGEMTPIQLWETTMDPEKRALVQVSIQDAVEADKIFTILMGDEVEPRRKFIEENALEAQNLDI